MSKYLIVNTSAYAASGVGSKSAEIIVGADNIVSIIPNGVSAVDIVYHGNVRAELTLSDAVASGDYSVITFLTKQIERLQSGESQVFSLPKQLPNCFNPAGQPLSIRSVTVTQPCCAP